MNEVPQGMSGLRRDLGLVGAVGVGLGAVMGAGIFVVTGVAAQVAGPAFLLGLAVAGAAAAFNGLSSAQLAANYPQSGGTYEYGYRLLNPAAGFAAGWMFLVGKLAAAGTVALGFGHYAAALLPGLPARPAALAAVVLVTAANLAGIRRTGWLNLAIVALTLFALGAFAVAGIPSFDAANLRPFAPHGWRGTAESSALLFFAYTGYARLATLGEEVREPEKTIPRAIIATLALSFVIYAAVAVAAVGTVGAEALAASRSPLERAAEVFGTRWIGPLLGVGAASALLGVLLSQVLGISRMMLAMARRRDLPVILGRIGGSRGVPTYGIMLTGLITLGLVIFGTLESVVAAAAFAILLYYALANLSALKLGREQRLYPPWIAWAGLVSCLVMSLSLKLEIILMGLALLALGFLSRLLTRRPR